MKSWVRRTRNVILIIACIPIVLILLYRLPFVHPVSTLMLADLITMQTYDRRWTPLEDLGKNGPAAVIMSEDGQFCRHYGVDWREMKAVVTQALDGGNVRGASTITMQTAKNLFLWNGRQMVRKIMELPLAVLVDLILPKKRVLEIYLNIAEWAPGVYGLEAAAQHYFGKAAKDLTPRQAALLAVTLPNPASRNPAKPSKALNSLANIIERRARGATSHIQCILPGA